MNVNPNSIPTQTFSSSLYNNRSTDEAILKILSSPPQHRTLESTLYKVLIFLKSNHSILDQTPFFIQETKLNHLENIVNGQGKIPWTGKPELNWQNKTKPGDIENVPRGENWSMAQIIGNNINNDWFIKSNWVQMAEVDKQLKQSKAQSLPKHSSSNFGLVTNGIYLLNKFLYMYI